MELEDETFFMGSHAPTLEARVEVVDPPEAAALSCAVEACMEITWGEARRESIREGEFSCCDFAQNTSI